MFILPYRNEPTVAGTSFPKPRTALVIIFLPNPPDQRNKDCQLHPQG
nr:MAG TPA_asm: hypothetical protein [Caudoviricetes sp.]DAV04363.1 MAG TPA: hypothetical protein [Caudoviricetes sp.]